MMADCVQMLKDWKRMCKAMTGMNGCEDCPIVRNTHGARCGDMPCEMQDVETIAREVEKWAAEHPEQVYPTLEQVIAEMYLRNGRTKYHNIAEWMRNESIPADVAEKLGIEPKEGKV